MSGCGQRWQAISTQYTLRSTSLRLEESTQSLFTLALELDQLLVSSFANLQHIISRLSRRANREQCYDVWLLDYRELGVLSSNVSLPVWVLCNVCRWYCDRVVVFERIVRAWGGIAELRIEWNTGRSLRIDSEEVVDACPDACRLDCVFLACRVNANVQRPCLT